MLGARGQLGSALTSALTSTAGDASIRGVDKDDFDLSDLAALEREFASFSGSIVINASAFTDVDGAEKNPDLARAINASAVGKLGELCQRGGVPIIHVSTDFVFDGALGRAYRESDTTHPLSVYGQTKWQGEQLLLASGAKAIVLRTAWLWSTTHKSFVTTMLRLARERTELSVVDDQVGSPTWAADLARAIATLATRIRREPAAGEQLAGLYHLAGEGAVDRCSFARAILELDPKRSEHKCTKVQPVSSDAFPLPAKRPTFAPLDCSLAASKLGLRLPPWRESLRDALALRTSA